MKKHSALISLALAALVLAAACNGVNAITDPGQVTAPSVTQPPVTQPPVTPDPGLTPIPCKRNPKHCD